MARALRLAARGLGRTSPNPMVGATIVAADGTFPSVRDALRMLLTFICVLFAWIFFRADDLGHAVGYLRGIASASLFSAPATFSRMSMGLIVLFLAIEWAGRRGAYGLQRIGTQWPRVGRWLLYYGLLLLIFRFTGTPGAFIYFQF